MNNDQKLGLCHAIYHYAFLGTLGYKMLPCDDDRLIYAPQWNMASVGKKEMISFKSRERFSILSWQIINMIKHKITVSFGVVNRKLCKSNNVDFWSYHWIKIN